MRAVVLVLGAVSARVVETRCRCWALAVRMVETAGAGAGAVSWQCAGILLGLGRAKPTGFADCAHAFVRVNLYAQDHTALSFCRSLLQAR